jgi:hypothetical protein
MTEPGFTAERCVNRPPARYRQWLGHFDTTATGRVGQAIPITPEEWYQLCHFAGCGAVSTPDGSTRCVCYHRLGDMRQ